MVGILLKPRAGGHAGLPERDRRAGEGGSGPAQQGAAPPVLIDPQRRGPGRRQPGRGPASQETSACSTSNWAWSTVQKAAIRGGATWFTKWRAENSSVLAGWLPGVAGEAGQCGPGAVGQGGCPPLLVDAQCCAQAGFGFPGRAGEPGHLGFGLQHFGLQRGPGGRRDEGFSLINELPGGGVLAAAGQYFGPGGPPPGLGVEVAGPASALASSVSWSASSRRPCV